jgi:hypothetical protein
VAPRQTGAEQRDYGTEDQARRLGDTPDIAERNAQQRGRTQND